MNRENRGVDLPDARTAPSDERIEAAAQVMWVLDAMGDWETGSEPEQRDYKALAWAMLQAADAVSSPREEALTAALANLVEVASATRDELSKWGWGDMHYGNNTPQLARVVQALADIDASLDDARALLAVSSPKETRDG